MPANGQLTLILELAKHPQSSVARWAYVDTFDIVERTLFVQTNLYRSYCNQACQNLLGLAKTKQRESNRAEALKLLDTARVVSSKIQDLSGEGYSWTIDHVCNLFDDEVPRITRLEQVLEDQSQSAAVMKLLRDWGPDEGITLVCDKTHPVVCTRGKSASPT